MIPETIAAMYLAAMVLLYQAECPGARSDISDYGAGLVAGTVEEIGMDKVGTIYLVLKKDKKEMGDAVWCAKQRPTVLKLGRMN
jgi:hypothetical protein